jgi:hypothetical protein
MFDRKIEVFADASFVRNWPFAEIFVEWTVVVPRDTIASGFTVDFKALKD